MKIRILVFLLAAAIAVPAGARPIVVPHHRGSSWVRVWNGFLGFFRGFHLLDASNATEHGFPPPACATSWTIQ
jgi:hypothetical protein